MSLPMLKAFVVLCLLQTTLVNAQTLSLNEAIRYALAHSVSYDTAKRNVEIRELEHKNTRARFLPSLDLSTSHGIEKKSPQSSTDPWASTLSLILTENLYDNGESITRYQIAQINFEIASIHQQKTRDELCLEIAKKFYQLSQANAAFQVRANQLATLQKQLDIVERQFKQGMRQKKDTLRLQSEVQRAEIAHSESRNTIERSKIDLGQLLSASDPSLDYQPLELHQLVLTAPSRNIALDKNYDFKAEHARKKILDLEVSLENRKYWPQIKLLTSASYQNNGYLGSPSSFSSNEQYGWALQLNLTMNFFDWGILKRNVAIAETRRIVGENQIKSDLKAVEVQAANLMLDLNQLVKSHKLTNEQ